MKQSIPFTLFLVASLIALSGCDRKPLTHNKPLAPDKLHSATPTKPHSPISIDYTLRGTLAVGSAIQVDISVFPGFASRTLDLSVSTSDGLTISSTKTQFHYQGVAAKASVNESVAVVSNTDGLHYLHVFVKIDTTAGVRTTAFSIPISIGTKGSEPAMKTNGKITTEEGEAPVIEMPADVTIRKK